MKKHLLSLGVILLIILSMFLLQPSLFSQQEVAEELDPYIVDVRCYGRKAFSEYELVRLALLSDGEVEGELYYRNGDQRIPGSFEGEYRKASETFFGMYTVETEEKLYQEEKMMSLSADGLLFGFGDMVLDGEVIRYQDQGLVVFDPLSLVENVACERYSAWLDEAQTR